MYIGMDLRLYSLSTYRVSYMRKVLWCMCMYVLGCAVRLVVSSWLTVYSTIPYHAHCDDIYECVVTSLYRCINVLKVATNNEHIPTNKRSNERTKRTRANCSYLVVPSNCSSSIINSTTHYKYGRTFHQHF